MKNIWWDKDWSITIIPHPKVTSQEMLILVCNRRQVSNAHIIIHAAVLLSHLKSEILRGHLNCIAVLHSLQCKPCFQVSDIDVNLAEYREQLVFFL